MEYNKSMKFTISLPIDSIKEQIISSYLHYKNIILKASPGSGKTTRVPLYLLQNTKKKIYILEPRRLAAKWAALQVARELNELIGLRVGYIFKDERALCEQTQILFLTEGTFLKILSQNKNLEGVDLIIIDEFHERHLSTDAALSFVLKLQKETRPDLKIMVMSATIETDDLQNYLATSGTTTTIELTSHRFPLEVTYLPNTTSKIQAPLHKKILGIIEDILDSENEGDLLVFLPGMREIRDAEEALSSICLHYDIQCFILHGDLDSAQQDQVLKTSNKRRIILSTNIAESSVTIPGIRIVVDSGLQRESSYNFFSGLPELKITKISKAQAIQRAGRANRENKGYCFRLFAELDYQQRPYLHKSEISKSDLSELYLMSIDLFKASLDQIHWFESPPESALKNASLLLFAINAIDQEKKITEIGKKIIKYPLHPRLGRIMVEALKSSPQLKDELLLFLADFLKEKNIKKFTKQFSFHGHSLNTQISKSLEELILTGFPDRVARARGEKFFDVITQNGETLKIANDISHLFDPNHSLWVVLDLNNKGEASKIVAIYENWLYDLEPFPIKEDVHYLWDEKKELVLKNEQILLGKIILSESRDIPLVSNEAIISILMEKAFEHLLAIRKTQEYERLLTLNKIINNIDLDLSKNLKNENILKDFFKTQNHFNQEDKTLLSHLFLTTLKEVVDPDELYNLNFDLPMTIQLTDRRKIPIQYDRTQNPYIESLIQDFYGLSSTPILAKGKIPLTLKLLGPHKLAIQVTQDLSSFWNKTYPQAVKELSRDYPRHYWPSDPINARPILLKRQVPL